MYDLQAEVANYERKLEIAERAAKLHRVKLQKERVAVGYEVQLTSTNQPKS